MKEHWKKLGSHIVYRDRIAVLREDRYHFLPNDIVKDFFVLEFHDWVNIIPMTGDGRIVMIHQFRHGTDSETLEIPGGLIDDHEPDPKTAALRELEEETGYTSTDVIHLGTVEPNPAIQTNRCHTYLARDVKLKGDQRLDPTESIRVEVMERGVVFEKLRRGEITHGLVLAAFAHLMLFEGSHS
jgi:8-oxo-dGTP pyrophosphatase MutT (NUDIX family)